MNHDDIPASTRVALELAVRVLGNREMLMGIYEMGVVDGKLAATIEAARIVKETVAERDAAAAIQKAKES